jgi:hypothetical protein
MNLHFFLTMKHWQLFLLLMGIPAILQMVAISMLSNIDGLDMILEALPYVIILVAGVFLAWYHTLGTELHAKLPESVSMNLTVFRVVLAIPAVLVLSIAVIAWLVFTDHTEVFRGMDEAFVSVFLLLYFMSFFGVFYLLYFVAKCLVSVEEQAPVTFKQYIGAFFSLWFLPLGVWFFQPRVNAIFDKNNDNYDGLSRYDNIIDTF